MIIEQLYGPDTGCRPVPDSRRYNNITIARLFVFHRAWPSRNPKGNESVDADLDRGFNSSPDIPELEPEFQKVLVSSETLISVVVIGCTVNKRRDAAAVATFLWPTLRRNSLGFINTCLYKGCSRDFFVAYTETDVLRLHNL